MKGFGKIRLISIVLAVPAVSASSTAFAAVNYDTAWTFVYDGGRDSSTGRASTDEFFDVKPLANGECICAGLTDYSTLVIKLNSSGKVGLKKAYNTNNPKGQFNSQSARSIVIAKNGDFLIGGERYYDAWIMRLNPDGNIKWTVWYHDSLTDKALLSRLVTINSIHETAKGRIVCAAGDAFPDNDGYALNNYAAYLEFDSLGVLINWGEWVDPVSYEIAGFNIEETASDHFLLAGNQAVFYIDTNGTAIWKHKYTFSLTGVGTETNNIMRAKKLRDGSLMVAGQAYEGNCWVRFKKLYYDAWWSPISTSGSNQAWDTAGAQGINDVIYDFTQLSNGNLAFVGKKGSFTQLGGVWAFVTDSSGKNILWEKQTPIPYRSTDGNAPSPLAVCASPDSGFTVVGKYPCTDSLGGMNAFAAHFIPKPPTAALKSIKAIPSSFAIQTKVLGTKVIFSVEKSRASIRKLSIYTLAGKCIAHLTNSKAGEWGETIEWERKGIGRGVFYYIAIINESRASGKVGL